MSHCCTSWPVSAHHVSSLQVAAIAATNLRAATNLCATTNRLTAEPRRRNEPRAARRRSSLPVAITNLCATTNRHTAANHVAAMNLAQPVATRRTRRCNEPPSCLIAARRSPVAAPSWHVAARRCTHGSSLRVAAIAARRRNEARAWASWPPRCASQHVVARRRPSL